jgi:fermentation-respiration switch protein FrsA (DUF1100 family)
MYRPGAAGREIMMASLWQRGSSMFSVLALRSAFWRRSWRHRLASRIAFLAYLYLGVLLVLLALENRFIFVPATAARDWQPPPADLNIQDVELTSAEGTRIHAWWMTPRDWRPEQGALLYCHGNAGNLSHRGEVLRRWRDLMHLAVLIFDYPGYGRSEGRPTEAGCYAAGDVAYDWLISVAKVPGERIVLYGGSLGGAIATDLAVRWPHRALVLVSAFSSLPDMAQRQFPWLPARWLVRNRFDNLRKIAACHRPVFLAHGTADRVVPFAQGELLFAAANEPKQFFPMRGYDHNHTPGPDFYEALRQFLERTETISPAGS